MRRMLFFLLLLTATPAAQGSPQEVRQLYARFVQAQNAADFTSVRATLLEGPEFLWVSNGLSIWGTDAAIARMQQYHGSEFWQLEAQEQQARVVALDAGTAVLHIPVMLRFGSRAAPTEYGILVTALCRSTPTGWRIVALLTTDRNSAE